MSLTSLGLLALEAGSPAEGGGAGEALGAGVGAGSALDGNACSTPCMGDRGCSDPCATPAPGLAPAMSLKRPSAAGFIRIPPAPGLVMPPRAARPVLDPCGLNRPWAGLEVPPGGWLCAPSPGTGPMVLPPGNDTCLGAIVGIVTI
jgi:hypothetical protein